MTGCHSYPVMTSGTGLGEGRAVAECVWLSLGFCWKAQVQIKMRGKTRNLSHLPGGRVPPTPGGKGVVCWEGWEGTGWEVGAGVEKSNHGYTPSAVS